MAGTVRFSWRGVLVLGAWLALGATPWAAGKPDTARARLAEARAAAAQWQKDAALVTVSALRAAADGTAPRHVGGWVYTFYSKGARKWAGFHAGPQALERTDLPAGLTEPLSPDFVDSDAVLAEVRKHGFQKQGEALVSLMFQRDPNLKPGVYWCAAGEADLTADAGMRGYCVDPASGKFVARMAGGAIPASAAAKPPPAAKPAAPAAGGLAGLDPAQCGGFTPEDAAAVLGVPAGKLARRVERLHASLWSCSFGAGTGGPQVVFSLEVAVSAAEAEEDMERYRANLGDNYSDLMGLGDDGLWTEVNRTATFRKQNLTLQVQAPPEKFAQLKVARAFFARH